MEPDVKKGTAYYNILKSNAAYLDFLLPQYYNGYTRPAIDGLSNISNGPRPNALPHYSTLVNDMFGGDATKVVFGFCVSLCMYQVLVIFYFYSRCINSRAWNQLLCLTHTRLLLDLVPLYAYMYYYFHVQISDCSGSGSNASIQQAASVMTQLHSTHTCNGGAFFWVVKHDTNGAWSNAVNGAISSVSSCGAGPPTPTIAPPPTNPSPTNPLPTNPRPISALSPPPHHPSGVNLVASGGSRCGTSELDAREMCGNSCTHSGQCPSGTFCYPIYPNYCDDPNFTPFRWIDPDVSTSWARCGKSEVDARSFCKPVCNSDVDCPVSGERCYGIHQNYCGSQVAGGSRMLRGI